MGKKSKRAKADKAGKPQKSGKLPKSKCCVSKDKCKRCPLVALKQGTLPPGYTVKKRRLVRAA